MNPASQPFIYISCVSAEFRTTRRRIAGILTRMGYRPVMQEIFGSELGDLRNTLRSKIDGCQGLIQIVGQAYGPESPVQDHEFGRVSYAQLEFLHARKKKLPTWLIIADGCTADTIKDKLNLPSSPAHADPVAYQAEVSALQTAYRNAREKAGEVLAHSPDDADLDATIQSLGKQFSSLPKPKATAYVKSKYVEKESNVLRYTFGLMLIAIALAIPLYLSRKLKDKPAPPPPLLTVQHRIEICDTIRVKLNEASIKLYNAGIFDSERARSIPESLRLKGLAENELNFRKSKTEPLVRAYSEVTKTEFASSVLDKLVSILANEGIEPSLAYINQQKLGILDGVKSRGAGASTQNRIELFPLLKTVDLLTILSRNDNALSLLNEILAVDPKWTDAISTQFWAEIYFGNRILARENKAQALPHYKSAEKIAQRLIELEPNNRTWKQCLEVSSERLNKDTSAEEANSTTRNSTTPPVVDLNDPAVILEQSAGEQTDRADFAAALVSYAKALEIRRARLASNPGSSQTQEDLAILIIKIGTCYQNQKNIPDALVSFSEAQTILLKPTMIDTQNRVRQEALLNLSSRVGEIKTQTNDLSGALKAYLKAQDIARKLASDNPGDLTQVKNSWIYNIRVAESLERMNRMAEAKGYWKRALESIGDARIRFPAQGKSLDPIYVQVLEKSGQ